MRLKRFVISSLFLLATVTLATHAGASPITYRIDFTSYGPFPDVPPEQVNGSFTITFDPQLNYSTPQTSGVTINYLNLPFFPGITVGFEYFPGASDLLEIGAVTGPGQFGVIAGTPSFLFRAKNFQPNGPFSPTFYPFFDWSNTGLPEVVHVDNISGTIAPVPEGNTLLLLATGAVGAIYFVPRSSGLT
jgi:hypothetical protein